jgi:hypothetical protein
VGHVTFFWWGFFGALAAYLVSVWMRHIRVDVAKLILSVGEGGAVGSGIHLVLCVFRPQDLVEIIDPQGIHLKIPAGTIFKIDLLHSAHIAAGGIAVIVLAGGALYFNCTGKGGGNH